VTFTYLPTAISDDEFLGGVVSNPHDLTLDASIRARSARAQDVLSPQALGSPLYAAQAAEVLAETAELLNHYRDSPHVLWY
jgi:hypothetical protein